MIEDEILPLCQSQGVGVIAFNPLAGGMLTGRYQKGQDVQQGTRFGLANSGELYRKRYWKEAVFEEVEALKQFLAPRDRSLTHVALAWVLQQPVVTSAIIGASRPEQLEDSLQGVDLIFDDEERAYLDQVWYNLPRERDTQIARR